jgi:dTDP-4-amino-4,6-dideoxygalactose transaminase
MNRIFLSPPHIGDLERKYVEEAFDTNWISPAGPHITAFEQELASYLGEDVHVAALSSGTAAIHLALIILGVKHGDEVICSTFTFSGSCNPIIYVGATPVFVDSDPTTWNLDPTVLREAIINRIAKTGKKPKAIIVVDLYGMPAKLDEITAISREFDIPLIEDAAEGLGSSFRGRKLGTFGDFGILSFNGNKIITTSGGGALVSKNAEFIEKARFLATQARDKASYYQHTEIGYNYRLSNVCAGIGRGQLKVLDERVKQRRSNFDFYVKNLGNDSEFEFLREPDGIFSNRWLTTVLIRVQGLTPENARLAMENENIESRPLWKPMHLQPVFSRSPYYGNRLSEKLFNEGLCLPSGSALDYVNLGRIVACLKSAY